ncbi:hypothetical protein COT69_00130 [candidate division WWE3 bacterium CG09_land_8_20_14_0_10_39_24]|uniref:Short-chain dehydrogenase n=1 Tax=candidate division WWE3 bacterium CG09_land_8_20_14_0_10_39_24 TaxID=1975088 RepID=A0A2H0WKJ3_UNCKA|nr:MAG: hypothetical protein BK003_00125 [bacterium CG09_39_24]PIS13156.1 MAG: hypothetical protein COT69_00130 [candidate division WWE3 bacterium CG09_land_8_20_14_0_10_39_24]
MARFLITGVSSGIGRVLTLRLVREGHTVWGIARRKDLLINLKEELGNTEKFIYTPLDISEDKIWGTFVCNMRKNDFTPNVVIFNAAISKNDLIKGLDVGLTEKIFDVNFFSILCGIRDLLSVSSNKMQFIAISSSSAFKGSGVEGIGYSASKAALSIAFESLHQKYVGKHSFKVVFLGPVNFGMTPFKKGFPLSISVDTAVSGILKAVRGTRVLYFYPALLFYFIKITKLFPSDLYFKILSKMESFHVRMERL